MTIFFTKIFVKLQFDSNTETRNLNTNTKILIAWFRRVKHSLRYASFSEKVVFKCYVFY